MIPPPNVTFCALDDIEVIGDDLSVFMLLSDGSTVAVCLPIDELVRRGYTIIEASDGPAFREVPILR